MLDEKFDIAIKAIDLMVYTMTVTSNRKRYPVKHIVLVQRIQNKCMDIYEAIVEANAISLTKKQEREDLQKKAISCCNQLSCYIELSMRLRLISATTVASWQKKINDVKYMTLAWKQSEKNR